MNDRTERHYYELNTESRLTRLESTNEAILKTLVEIRSDIKDLENKLSGRIDKLENKLGIRIDKLDGKLWQIIFLISSSILGLIISKICHWI